MLWAEGKLQSTEAGTPEAAKAQSVSVFISRTHTNPHICAATSTTPGCPGYENETLFFFLAPGGWASSSIMLGSVTLGTSSSASDLVLP